MKGKFPRYNVTHFVHFRVSYFVEQQSKKRPFYLFDYSKENDESYKNFQKFQGKNFVDKLKNNIFRYFF